MIDELHLNNAIIENVENLIERCIRIWYKVELVKLKLELPGRLVTTDEERILITDKYGDEFVFMRNMEFVYMVKGIRAKMRAYVLKEMKKDKKGYWKAYFYDGTMIRTKDRMNIELCVIWLSKGYIMDVVWCEMIRSRDARWDNFRNENCWKKIMYCRETKIYRLANQKYIGTNVLFNHLFTINEFANESECKKDLMATAEQLLMGACEVDGSLLEFRQKYWGHNAKEVVVVMDRFLSQSDIYVLEEVNRG